MRDTFYRSLQEYSPCLDNIMAATITEFGGRWFSCKFLLSTITCIFGFGMALTPNSMGCPQTELRETLTGFYLLFHFPTFSIRLKMIVIQ